MTQQELKTLHAYNSWATNRLFPLLRQLADEEYTKDLGSSHGGVKGTMVHLVGAEKVWLERFQGISAPFLSEHPPNTVGELEEIWQKTGLETARWLGMTTDRKLQETFSWKSLKGDLFSLTFAHAFQHVVNHSSYHRGQVVAMLRQLGRKAVATDMILFYLESARG